MQHYTPSTPVSVVCLSAPSDTTLLAQWETHLLPLQQAMYLTVWSERHLSAGDRRREELDTHLEQADVIVLLLSAEFFASEECYELMKRVMHIQQKGLVRVLPLVLRPCAWQESPLSPLAYLPANGVPVTRWDDPEEAFQECVQGVLRLLGRPTITSLPTRSSHAVTWQQNRGRMLQRLHRSYEDLMRQSLQGITGLELGLTQKPAAVQNLVTFLRQFSHRTEQHLPSGTSILQAYDEAAHELLILGEPGSGKSTLLLDLALHLVERAETNVTHPLPIIVPLSSWAVKRPPLEIWLCDQLTQLYDVPHQISKQWVEEDGILPLLDGFDEIDEAARPACIAAINSYHQAHLLVSLVVCSRKAEYEVAAAQQHLMLQRAVVVQSLTKAQVDATLNQAGKSLSGLRSAIKKNTSLGDLATTPLMLSVLMLTYQGTSVRVLSGKESVLHQQVWTDYIERMVESKGDNQRYSLPQTCTWLGWLAQQMREHNQTVFYLEQLQPSWLSAGQLRAYLWQAVSLPAMVIGVLVSILVELFFFGGTDLTSLLQNGVLGGLLGRVLVEQQGALRHGWRTQIAMSTCIGLIYALSFVFDLGHSFRPGDWLIYGLIFSVTIGLGSFLLQRLLMTPVHSFASPGNRFIGLWKHVVRFFQVVHGPHLLLVAVIIGLSLGLSYGLSLGISDGRYYGPTNGLRFGLSLGLANGLIFGLRFGLIFGLISVTLEAQMGDVQLTERLRWTWDSLRRALFTSKHLRLTLLLACISTLLAGLSVVLSDGLSVGLRFGLSFGLSLGLSLGLAYWLLFGLLQGISQERIEDQDRRAVNEGVHLSLRNSVIMGIISGGMVGIIGAVSVGLRYGRIFGLRIGLDTGLRYGLLMSIGGALLMCMLTGGLATLRHYTIRLLLARSHTFPWQAVPFLEDAAARILLRRVGSGYSFAHRLLLEHFADQETGSTSPSTS